MADAVSLRPVRESDLAIFYAHQRDPQALLMAAFDSRDHAEFMAHWHRILEDSATRLRAIVVGETPAGYVSSWIAEGEREIGYWIGREFWGRGVTTAALGLFLAEFPERPLRAFVARHNRASIQVLCKCGFRADAHRDTAPRAGQAVGYRAFRLDRAAD